MIKSADISPCGKFRYRLARYWQDDEISPSDKIARPLLFVMLNPSTADADVDDATIRRCIGFARRLDFDGIEVVNLFAYRTRSPDELKRAGWPQGDTNRQMIRDVAAAVAQAGGNIIAAWGGNARGRPEAAEVLAMLRADGHTIYALRLSKDGIPWHPLMLPYGCPLIEVPQ